MSTSTSSQPPIIAVYDKRKCRVHVASWLALVVVFLAAGSVVFFFDPSHSTFYPSCIWKQMTGWSCSACGCLRATHQLLHGHVVNAFRFNPLFVLLVPVFVLSLTCVATGRS